MDSLTRKLAQADRDKIDAMARTRELERERSELTSYLDQKEKFEGLLKQKESQLQLLTKRLTEVEQKLLELSASNEKLAFELKHSEEERRLEKSSFESQLDHLQKRLICQPTERESSFPMAQSTYFGRDPNGRSYRQQQQ